MTADRSSAGFAQPKRTMEKSADLYATGKAKSNANFDKILLTRRAAFSNVQADEYARIVRAHPYLRTCMRYT